MEADARLVAKIVLGAIGLGVTGAVFSLLFRRNRACRGSRAGKIRPPLDQVLAEPDLIKYNLKDLHAPVVSGFLFRLFVRVSYSPIGSPVVRNMLRRSNLDLLSGEYLDDGATFYPSPPRPLVDNTNVNQASLQPVARRIIADSCTSLDSLYSCLDFHRAYEQKRCTPVDVAKHVLLAIKNSNSRNPPLRAIVESDSKVVLAMAHASAERWEKETPLSLLDGVPVAIKGELNVAPYPFMSGACFPSVVCGGIPEGRLVQKLREAGAVIIGVSNLQEFGTGVLGSNPNKLHGMARNPHDTDCYCGGSSSGSAACVAAGLCPVTLGTDGGGSIRVPASLCGIVSLKPTHCLLDRSGIIRVSHTVGVVGPMCSSVVDVAVTMDILTRGDGGSGQVLDLQNFGKTSLEGVRVGIYREFFEHANEEVVASCKMAVKKMVELGAEVVEVKIAELEEARVAHMVSIASEMAEALKIDTDSHFHEMNLETLLLLAVGYHSSSLDYITAQKQRTRSVTILKEVFEKVDLLVTPATACVAPRIHPGALSAGIADAFTSSILLRFNFLANLTGIPGITLPVGFNRDNLPISIQLMASWYEEGLLCRVSYALEQAGLRASRPKNCFYDVLH